VFPSFRTLTSSHSLDFTCGLVPPIYPVTDLNQAEVVCRSGVRHVQDIGPFYFQYYTLRWDLLKHSEFLLLRDWYFYTANGKKNQFYYTTPYGDVAVVTFESFGKFTEVSSQCLAGEVVLKELAYK
jgi:hypothetical protein